MLDFKCNSVNREAEEQSFLLSYETHLDSVFLFLHYLKKLKTTMVITEEEHETNAVIQQDPDFQWQETNYTDFHNYVEARRTLSAIEAADLLPRECRVTSQERGTAKRAPPGQMPCCHVSHVPE